MRELARSQHRATTTTQVCHNGTSTSDTGAPTTTGDAMGIPAHGAVEIWLATQLVGDYYSTDRTAESQGGAYRQITGRSDNTRHEEARRRGRRRSRYEQCRCSSQVAEQKHRIEEMLERKCGLTASKQHHE